MVADLRRRRHRLGAHLDNLEPFLERHRAREHERGVLTQRQTGTRGARLHDGGGIDSELLHRGETREEKRGLRELGGVQLLLRPVDADVEQVVPEDILRLVAHLFNCRDVRHGLEHAHRLGTLPGEEEGDGRVLRGGGAGDGGDGVLPFVRGRRLGAGDGGRVRGVTGRRRDGVGGGTAGDVDRRLDLQLRRQLVRSAGGHLVGDENVASRLALGFELCLFHLEPLASAVFRVRRLVVFRPLANGIEAVVVHCPPLAEVGVGLRNLLDVRVLFL